MESEALWMSLHICPQKNVRLSICHYIPLLGGLGSSFSSFLLLWVNARGYSGPIGGVGVHAVHRHAIGLSSETITTGHKVSYILRNKYEREWSIYTVTYKGNIHIKDREWDIFYTVLFIRDLHAVYRDVATRMLKNYCFCKDRGFNMYQLLY